MIKEVNGKLAVVREINGQLSSLPPSQGAHAISSSKSVRAKALSRHALSVAYTGDPYQGLTVFVLLLFVGSIASSLSAPVI